MEITINELATKLGMYEYGLRQKLCNWQLQPFAKHNNSIYPKALIITPESIKILKKLLIKRNGPNHNRLNPKIENYLSELEKELKNATR